MKPTVSPLELLWVSMGFVALAIVCGLLTAALGDLRDAQENDAGEPYYLLAYRWITVDSTFAVAQLILLTMSLLSAATPEAIREELRQRDRWDAGLGMTLQVLFLVAPLLLFRWRKKLSRYEFRAIDREEES